MYTIIQITTSCKNEKYFIIFYKHFIVYDDDDDDDDDRGNGWVLYVHY